MSKKLFNTQTNEYIYSSYRKIDQALRFSLWNQKSALMIKSVVIFQNYAIFWEVLLRT